MVSVLFICLGNICRSPMAETIFRDIVEKEGKESSYKIDSAGLISFHEGESADNRMRNFAYQRGYRITHISRPVKTQDFYDFDMIIGMDDDNMSKLRRLRPDDAKAELHKMTEYLRNMDEDEVPDPYYGGAAGFTHVIDLLEDACRGLYENTCNK
ncbi:MAG: low molecular weight phosphotyrosine protein phosphatase [Bacteroidales bacterium]|nr:low molecular weight phosphotyrosine protein phosphatase [Bacteroidales bacterium]